ncbi:MAG: hypothetical protein J3Q66DRAFT_432563 [Benniella sp.]|nr:MAG: hypothetical protein J3Q66DRAFT_432563 [Benniella sp.]
MVKESSKYIWISGYSLHEGFALSDTPTDTTIQGHVSCSAKVSNGSKESRTKDFMHSQWPWHNLTTVTDLLGNPFYVILPGGLPGHLPLSSSLPLFWVSQPLRATTPQVLIRQLMNEYVYRYLRKMRKEILNPTLPLLQQCADLSLIGSHETRIIARVLNAFCLQFQRADIFWNELPTVVLEMESLLRRVTSSPFRHSLLKSLIRYNDEAVDSLDCLARMRLFAIMKGRSPRDSMMRMQLFNSMVSAIKRSGKQIPQHVASESYNNVVWMQDFDRGQVAKTFSGDRITVSLTIVNCLRSLTQTWISQMRIPLAQDLDHDQGPLSTFKGRYCSMIWISSTTIPLAGRQGLNTARSGDLHTPQGFSREAQRVTYKAIQCSSLDGRSFDVQTFGIGSFGNYSSSFSAAMFGFSSHSQDSSIRSSRKEIRHTLVFRRSHFDFDDDSDSIVTDDTAFDDWDRINILGAELLNVLQTIPRPLFGLDGYISADDSSCRYGVQHVLDNICSWYKSYQQEQGMLELDPADNDELPWKQGECLSEQWQDPDRTILIRAGRLCESTEPRMNPEVMLLHLVEA